MKEGISNSIAGAAAVAAPATGATLSSLGVLPAGVYRVRAVTQNPGTQETTAAGLMNVNIRRGTNVVTAMPVTSQPVTQVVERVTLDGTQSINAVVGGVTAIAGSIYVVALSAVRVAD